MKSFDQRLAEAPDSVRVDSEVYAQLLQLGTAIRSARLEREWSQSELAVRSQVTQGDISKIENGTLPQGPTAMTLCRLSQALGMQFSLVPSSAIPEMIGNVSEVYAQIAKLLESAQEVQRHLQTTLPGRVGSRSLGFTRVIVDRAVSGTALTHDPRVRHDLEQLVGHIGESLLKAEGSE
jgi:transcriptional regulator with XRE-family HTH domain